MRNDLMKSFDVISKWLFIIIVVLFIIRILLIVVDAVVSVSMRNLKNLKLKKEITNLTKTLDECSKSITVYFIIFSFILAMFKIVLLDEVFGVLQKMAKKYYDIFLILIGAFISSAIGIISSFIKNTSIRNKNSDSLMLYYEISSIVKELQYMSPNIKKSKDIDVMKKILAIKQIKYDEFWIKKYQKVCAILTNEHYECLKSFYNSVDKFNTHIENEDYRNAKITLNRILNEYNDDILMSKMSISLPELMEDLLRISESKKPLKFRSSKIIRGLYYIFNFKKHFNYIENIIYEEISIHDDETIDCSIVDDEVHKKIEKDKKISKVLNKNDINKLIFDCSLNSQKFNRSWGVYYLNENDNKQEN